MARPSKFNPTFPDQARKLCKLGATDLEIADFFAVNVATLYRWKNDYPEFCEALKEAKIEADNRVEESLFHRATGYSHDAVKIFNDKDNGVTTVPYREHYPPDTTAAIFWLKNRQPERWRDKTEQAVTGKFDVTQIERVIVKAADTDSGSVPAAPGASPVQGG